jgi:hypothetical protein
MTILTILAHTTILYNFQSLAEACICLADWNKEFRSMLSINRSISDESMRELRYETEQNISNVSNVLDLISLKYLAYEPCALCSRTFLKEQCTELP